MNLFKIGGTTLNMDRVNGIQDHQTPTDPNAPPGLQVIRVLFDDSSLDLHGLDAQVLRRWLRHNARNLTPVRDEDGEELVSPEEQLHRVTDHVITIVDRMRPRDPLLRAWAHRLSDMIEIYITGQLQPVIKKSFLREFEADESTPAT